MMSRLVILVLFFYLFSSQPSPTEAADPCEIRGVASCWAHTLSRFCNGGACPEDLDCRVKKRLTDCMRFFCHHDDMLDFPFAKLLGICSEEEE